MRQETINQHIAAQRIQKILKDNDFVISEWFNSYGIWGLYMHKKDMPVYTGTWIQDIKK